MYLSFLNKISQVQAPKLPREASNSFSKTEEKPVFSNAGFDAENIKKIDC